MSIAVTVSIVIILLVAVVLALAARRPTEFAIQRTAQIRATPERIFPHIADFRRWSAWSPWEKIDPTMRKSYSGAPSGVGSVYEWEGNSKVGPGRMEILESDAPGRLRIQRDFITPFEAHTTTVFTLAPAPGGTVKLDFLKPFEAHNTATFTLAPVREGTDVTWKMYGPSPFVTKVMGVFFDMDEMVGKDFERGLASLKSVVEG